MDGGEGARDAGPGRAAQGPSGPDPNGVRWWNLPLEYSVRCKRRFQRGLPFLADLLGDDLAILLIAFALFSPLPLPTAAAIVLLGLSFWAVYEAGYFENDLIASSHERAPRLPPGFETFRHLYSERLAWLWAAGLGLAGTAVAVLGAGAAPFGLGAPLPLATPVEAATAVLAGFVAWLLLLVLTRATFRLYNAVDKLTRIYLYLPLQTFKYGFPAVFFELPAAGAVLVLAQIMRRWLPYLVRRLARTEEDLVPARLARLVVFVVGFLVLLPGSIDRIYLLQGMVAGGFLMMRAAKQTGRQLAAVRGVGGDTWRAGGRPDDAARPATRATGRAEPPLRSGAR